MTTQVSRGLPDFYCAARFGPRLDCQIVDNERGACTRDGPDQGGLFSRDGNVRLQTPVLHDLFYGSD
jgi:hypothetical protein